MRNNIPNEAIGNSITRIPPIKLIRDDVKEYSKGSYVTMKLRSIPTEEHLPSHDVFSNTGQQRNDADRRIPT